MTKVLSCRFYKCLRPFNMLTVKECSETVFFLEIKLTKFFTACKFRNKVALTMIFFSKSLKFYGHSRNGLQKMKKFLVLKIIAFESGTTNSQNREQDTSHWQSSCYETPPRFNISLKGIFLKSSSLRVIKNMMKVFACWFFKNLGLFKILTVKGCSETFFFRERSNQVFHSL